MSARQDLLNDLEFTEMQIRDEVDTLNEREKAMGYETPMLTFYKQKYDRLQREYLIMLQREHSVEHMGYYTDSTPPEDVKKEMDIISKNIKTKRDNDFGTMGWCAEFVMRCDQSFYADAIQKIPRYKAEKTKCINLCKKLWRKTRDPSKDMRVFTSSCISAKIPSGVLNWLYVEIVYSMFPGGQSVDKDQSIKEVLNGLYNKD